MGIASEYRRKLDSAKETVRGAVRHNASSQPYLDLSREHFPCGNGAGDHKLHDRGLCNFRQDLTALLPAPCPCWRSSWPT
jgi:hypothetical protein